MRATSRLTSRQQPLIEVPDHGVVAAATNAPMYKTGGFGRVHPIRCVCPAGCRCPGEGSHSHQRRSSGGPRPASRRRVKESSSPTPGTAQEVFLAKLDGGGSAASPRPGRPTHGAMWASMRGRTAMLAELSGSDQHDHHLVPAGGQSVEGGFRRPAEGAREVGPLQRSEPGPPRPERRSWPSPGGPGEVSNLTRVDDDHGQRRRCQGCHQWQFQAARSLQQHGRDSGPPSGRPVPQPQSRRRRQPISGPWDGRQHPPGPWLHRCLRRYLPAP